jgi:predicted O-methyltransferase YrrM
MNHPYQDPHDTYWSDGDPDVPVFQRPEEFNALLALFTERRPARILEVGTYYGGTLKQWARRSAPGTRIVSVDRYDITRADNRTRYAEWAAPGVKVIAIAGDSNAPSTIAQARGLGPYDWIVIDADHALLPATTDYAIYGGMCAPGGAIILHDIIATPLGHLGIEVPILWAQIKAGAQTSEFVQDYAAPWGGLGVVYR